MKRHWKSIAGVVLAGLMACAVVAPRLQGRPTAQAKFTLSFDAQWGKNVLSSGEYTVSISQYSSTAMIWVSNQNGRRVAVMLPQAFDTTQTGGKDAELVGIRHNGTVAIRELRLPDVGTFYFSLPKDLTTQVAVQPEMIQTVALESVGE